MEKNIVMNPILLIDSADIGSANKITFAQIHHIGPPAFYVQENQGRLHQHEVQTDHSCIKRNSLSIQVCDRLCAFRHLVGWLTVLNFVCMYVCMHIYPNKNFYYVEIQNMSHF